MKKFYSICLLAIALTLNSTAQVLLFEDFETTSLPPVPSTGNDNTWVNEDLDGLLDQSPQGRPGEWWIDTAFSVTDGADLAAISNSWTNDATTPISNYLITPPIHLNDASGSLSWKVASYQQPRFVDGMQVLVSTTGNDWTMFSDTLKVYGQYISGAALPTDSSYFSGGYVFSNDGFLLGSDYQYVEYTGDSARFIGILRPDSASLAQYSGQTIYIAFCHGTTDDNMISIDDIKVLGNGTVFAAIPSSNKFYLNAFPNPSTDKFTVQYSLPSTGSVNLSIYDITGKNVKSILNNMCVKGDYSFDVDIKNLPSGNYNIVLKTKDGDSISKITKL